jgi:glycosyltransferase involved in cell wall biosynthesis
MVDSSSIRISVIIPCYNQGRYLAEAIDSVLAQGRDDMEIIVVNDGSPDNTEAVALQYGDRIVYIAQENRGLSGARNSGIRAARGEYVALLDSDDVYLPGTLDKLSNYLDQHPNVGLVCGDALYYDGAECHGLYSSVMGKPRNPENFRWETVYYVPPSNTVMIRKEVLDQVPPFDEHLKNAAEDWLMWVRIARLYDMAYLDMPLTLYRQHGGNATKKLESINAGNRYASRVIVESPEFASYPCHFRAKLLYYRTATAWSSEPKVKIASFLLRAFITDPRQVGYGLLVLRHGLSNRRKRRKQLTNDLAS